MPNQCDRCGHTFKPGDYRHSCEDVWKARADTAEAALAGIRQRVRELADEGYSLWKPYGGDCPDCQTPYQASIISLGTLLDSPADREGDATA